MAVDGNDVVAVTETMAGVVDAVRRGQGPTIVEATTYRWHGHYEGDPQRYRTDNELDEWKQRDPLVVHARRLAEMGVDADRIATLAVDDRRRTRRSRRGRSRRRSPEIDTLGHFVLRDRPHHPEPAPIGPTRRCSA